MVVACSGMLRNAGMDKQGWKHTTCLLSNTQSTQQVASWLCLPSCSRTAEALVRSAARGESLQRWRATTHLIIDEASQAVMGCDWHCVSPGSPVKRQLMQ